MGKNIFNIWNDIDQKTPFAARRTHWSNKDIYVIVEEVVPDGKGYGIAFGNPTTKGVLNDYFEYNKQWCLDKKIPNAGVYGWEYVVDVSLDLKTNTDQDSDQDMKKEEQLNLNSKLDFGKYEGKSIIDIITNKPSYIVWAILNVNWFSLSTEALEELKKHIELSEDVIAHNNLKEIN